MKNYSSATKSYSGYKNDNGTYSNSGYSMIVRTPVGAEISVLHANTNKTTRYRMIEDSKGRKLLVAVRQKSKAEGGGVIYDVIVNYDMNSKAGLQAMHKTLSVIGLDAKRINILQGGKPIMDKSRKAADEEFKKKDKEARKEKTRDAAVYRKAKQEEERKRQEIRLRADQEYKERVARQQAERKRQEEARRPKTASEIQAAIERQRQRSREFYQRYKAELAEQEREEQEREAARIPKTRDSSRQTRFNF